MSFLNLPIKQKEAFNIIASAIVERWETCFNSKTPTISKLKFPTQYMGDFYEAAISNLKSLFRYCFPKDLLGKYSEPRPFYELDSVDEEISRRLISQKINPNAFLFKAPCRLGQGDFIRACYYLLNECLVYFPPWFLSWGTEEEIIWTNYNKNEFTHNIYPDIRVNKNLIADGDYGRDMRYTSRFYFKEEFPYFKGTFPALYLSEFSGGLYYPLQYGDEEKNEFLDFGLLSTTVTAGQSADIPVNPQVTGKINYYRTWGDKKYGSVLAFQWDRFAQIKVTAENLPTPTFKYLDD